MTTIGRRSHADQRIARARAAFREYSNGRSEQQRAAQIAALQTIDWQGRRLYTIRCHGTTGRGPHDVNVPEDMLWALIDIDTFICPFHAYEMLVGKGEKRSGNNSE